MMNENIRMKDENIRRISTLYAIVLNREETAKSDDDKKNWQTLCNNIDRLARFYIMLHTQGYFIFKWTQTKKDTVVSEERWEGMLDDLEKNIWAIDRQHSPDDFYQKGEIK